jgi:anti-sigma B factor antagonist
MHDGGGFPIELVSGVPVVTAPEEIDIINAAGLRSALLQAAADGSGALVADMTRTRFCDSAGLHALVAVHKRARAAGGELLLVVCSAAVLRVLAITGVDRVIPSFATLDDALAHRSPNGSKDHRGPDDGLGAVQGSQQARRRSTTPADSTEKRAGSHPSDAGSCAMTPWQIQVASQRDRGTE